MSKRLGGITGCKNKTSTVLFYIILLYYITVFIDRVGNDDRPSSEDLSGEGNGAILDHRHSPSYSSELTRSYSDRISLYRKI